MKFGKRDCFQEGKKQTLKKIGGIDAVSSATNQAYKIMRTLKPKKTDPLKKLSKIAK